MRLFSRLSVVLSAVAVLGFVAFSSVQARDKDHKGMHNKKDKHEMHKKHHGKKGACPMQVGTKKGKKCARAKACNKKGKHKKHKKHHGKEGACPMQPGCKKPEQCRKKMHSVIEDLESAQAALEDGKNEAASKKLSKAIKQLKQMKGMMHQQGGSSAEPVNTRCPIMGRKLDPENTPEELTRQFQGKTVGFCCAACPKRWDQLSEEEKKEALNKSK